MGSIPFPFRNNMIYIATFYSHFGAVRFKKMCSEQNVKAKMMPVPRTLSSSCGTCVQYEAAEPVSFREHTEEMEQMVLVTENGYEVLYRAENS